MTKISSFIISTWKKSGSTVDSGSERFRDHILSLVDLRLLLGKDSGFYKSIHIGMILCELYKFAVPVKIRSAVSYVCYICLVVDCIYNYGGRSIPLFSSYVCDNRKISLFATSRQFWR